MTFADANEELMQTGAVNNDFEELTLAETGRGESLARFWMTVGGAGKAENTDWLDETPPPREYLLSVKGKLDGWRVSEPCGMLPLGRVGMLAAAGGVGKSQMLAQLGVSVATGRPLFDTYHVDRPGHVLLIMAEEEQLEMRRRIFYTCKGLYLSDKEKERVRGRITFLTLSGVPVCLTQGEKDGRYERSELTDGRETIFAQVLRARLDNAGHDWSLLVFDPLSRFAGPDVEVDNNAATRFVQSLERFAQVPGTPTVLVAHHTSKSARKGEADGANAARGSTALTDGVRWQANLEVMGQTQESMPAHLTFKVTKSNYCAFPRPLTLVRQPDAHGVLSAAKAEHVEEYRSAIERAEVDKRVKKHELTAKVREQVAASRVANEDTEAQQGDVEIAVDPWQHAYEMSLLEDSGTESRGMSYQPMMESAE